VREPARNKAVKPAALKKQTSAGGVIFRINGSETEIALISVRGGKVWCLPKGLVDRGETPEMTAVREVREETGLTGKIAESLGEITYWYYIKGENAKCRKTVHFFLMEYVSGDTNGHDFEVDDAVWIPLHSALEKVSYKGDRSVIKRAQERLGQRHG
jgi:8-oxo-dGTP diphosphatase